MKPKYAMLKFRLPWRKGKTRYFDGDIYLQPWAPPSSTETRLITRGRKFINYDNVKYESQINNFQTNHRVAWHDHEIECSGGGDDGDGGGGDGGNGNSIDHCYDCWSEITIIKEYLANSSKFTDTAIAPTMENIKKYIMLFGRYGGASNKPPHGMYCGVRDISGKVLMLADTAVATSTERLRQRDHAQKTTNITKLLTE
jgi:hypothetical protein